MWDKEEFDVKRSNNAARCCEPKAETTTRRDVRVVFRHMTDNLDGQSSDRGPARGVCQYHFPQ
ncbi:MAG: hypothetical protein IJQ23_01215 [Clostridia bacterium]|nr:hypothetical protein [Clostridia bacterium]